MFNKTKKILIKDVFEVRLNKKMIDIETVDKQWKVQFGKKTKEYAMLSYLIQQGEELENAITLLFYSRLMLTDNYFLKLYQITLQSFLTTDKSEIKTLTRNLRATIEERIKDLNKEDDPEILEQEKAMYNAKNNKDE